MSVPTKDSALVSYGSNFDTRGTAAPADFNLTAGQMSAFHAKFLAFKASYDALVAAREAGVRSKPLAVDRDLKRQEFLVTARELYGFVQDSVSVPDARKIEIGVTPKNNTRTPRPAVGVAPVLSVPTGGVFGRQVRVNLRNPLTGKRGKPFPAIGVSLYSFVGPTPPAGTAGWESEGNVTRDTIIVQFDEAVAPGTKVWFTGFYYTERGLAGPACTPVWATTGHEGAEPLAG